MTYRGDGTGRRGVFLLTDIITFPVSEKDNFQVYKANVHGLPFDYDSVMMYQSHDFAKDPSKPTIEVIADPARPTGTSQKLTEMDIFTLNDLYSCSVSGCDDRDNGKVSFNNKCYYASSNM